jgi:thiosulfate dehydrogenase (quinone) large subunit
MKTRSGTPTPHRPDAGTSRRASRPRDPSVAHSWAAMPWSLKVLRAFLGVTFVYAGMNKFLDPNFLHLSGTDYIGVQLHAVLVSGTPIAPLIRLLAQHALLVGIAIGLTEIAVGLATLMGVAMLAAALVGFAINLTLWLSFTWHQHPYFLGSDSIYAVAWAALAFGIWETERARNAGAVSTVAARIDGLDRRAFLRGGTVAALSAMLGILGVAVAGTPARKSTGLARAATGPSNPSPHATPSTGPTAPAGPPANAPAGRVVATLSDLPVGGAVAFTGPAQTPAALFRLQDGRVVAFSRICTHAGCEVGYNPTARLLVCPCHGAEFDPAKRAQPVPGSPTSVPLPAIRVVVDQATGQVILPSA